MNRTTIPIATKDNDQPGKLKAELTDAIRFMIDQLPTIGRIARDMGAGFKSSTIGDGIHGGDTNTIVENLALNPKHDPAVKARDLILEFTEMTKQIQRVLRGFHHVLPVTPDEAAELENWHKAAEIPMCALCDTPIPDKVRRIDGLTYHTNPCYYRVYRTKATA